MMDLPTSSLHSYLGVHQTWGSSVVQILSPVLAVADRSFEAEFLVRCSSLFSLLGPQFDSRPPFLPDSRPPFLPTCPSSPAAPRCRTSASVLRIPPRLSPSTCLPQPSALNRGVTRYP